MWLKIHACLNQKDPYVTQLPDRLLRPYVVAYRLGYRETPDRPTFGSRAKARTAAQRADESAMGCFRTAISEGRVPRPDKYIGRVPHWKESTIAAFIESDNAPSRTKRAKDDKPSLLRKRRGRPAIAKAGEVESESANG